MTEKERQLIFGIRPILELLESGNDLEKVFIQKNLQGDLFKELIAQLRMRQIPLSMVPLEGLNKFTRKNHQGVVAFISPVKYHDLSELVVGSFESGRTPIFFALDRITDVRNFGAISRSAYAFGVDGILIPIANAAQINADAIKTSAGALTKIPVTRTADLYKSLIYLRDSGFQIIAVTEKTDQPLTRLDLTLPTAFVMGSEEDGISDNLLRMADHLANIPMIGNIGSLSVSAASAVVMYESIRQRKVG